MMLISTVWVLLVGYMLAVFPIVFFYVGALLGYLAILVALGAAPIYAVTWWDRRQCRRLQERVDRACAPPQARIHKEWSRHGR